MVSNIVSAPSMMMMVPCNQCCFQFKTITLTVILMCRCCSRAVQRTQGVWRANHRWQRQPAQVFIQIRVPTTGMKIYSSTLIKCVCFSRGIYSVSYELGPSIMFLCVMMTVAYTKCICVRPGPNSNRKHVSPFSVSCTNLNSSFVFGLPVWPEREDNLSGQQKGLLGLLQWLPGQDQRT